MIQDKPLDFYEQFHVIVLGLDSLEARRYMNSVACSFLEFDADGSPNLATVKPLIDGGTEGFKGHARVLIPGVTPCFECTLWLFPPQTKFPLCTLAETPRTAPHCIEYAKIVLWPRERPDDEFDADADEHMNWIFEKAAERAKAYGIPGVTYHLTQGVVKNIIPAIASTNALIAAACALEAFKLVTLCCTGLNNYMMYVGTDSIYTLSSSYEKDESCPICSAGVAVTVPEDATLQQVVDAMVGDEGLGKHLSAPSVSYGAANLYMRGALESATRGNLARKMSDLIAEVNTGNGNGGNGNGGVVLTVNDKTLVVPVKVRLSFSAAVNDGDGGGVMQN